MYQAITTKFHGATNTKGSRVSATSGSGHKIFVSWDYSLDVEDNHARAAKALAKKLNWSGKLQGGGTKTGYVWVFVGEPSSWRDRSRRRAPKRRTRRSPRRR